MATRREQQLAALDARSGRRGGRHDPERRRKSYRYGKQKGVTIQISAAELLAAGIDPNGPAPEYRVYPGQRRDGGLQLRLFR
jgi:hypothetical protein